MGLDVTLLPAQEEFLNVPHDCGTDIAIYQGGFGSGKTFSGSLLGILLCLMYPGIKGLVGANAIPMLRDTTLEQWFVHLNNMNLKQGRDWWYNVTYQRLTFKNGSIVFFKHLEDYTNFRSLEVGFIEIEEISLISRRTFLELKGRLRQKVTLKGQPIKVRRFFGHTNPEANKGWIWEFFVDKTPMTKKQWTDIKECDFLGRKTRTRVINKLIEDEDEFTKEKIRVQYRLIIAPSTQNPHLPKDQLLDFKSSFDPEMYKIFVLGEFGDYSSGLVSKGFNKDKQLLPITFKPEYPLHITCDFNVDPNCWFIAQRYDENYYYLDEIVVEHTDTEQCTMEFIRKFPPEYYPEVIINGDASGGNKQTAAVRGNNYTIIINMLKNAGYKVSPYPHIRPKNPDKIDRINAWNAKMCNASGEHSIFFNADIINGEYVPRTPRLIHAIENLMFAPGTNTILEPTRADLRKDPSTKFDPHCFDGASYLVEYYSPITKEVSAKREVPRTIVDSRFNLVGDFD